MDEVCAAYRADWVSEKAPNPNGPGQTQVAQKRMSKYNCYAFGSFGPNSDCIAKSPAAADRLHATEAQA
jgi:hypothetical protein